MAPEAHKKRLLEAGGDRTIVTDVLSGRYARVVANELTDAYGPGGPHGFETLPFPSQYIANGDVFAAASASDDADHLPLWAGQAIGRLQDLPWAGDVVADTVREARELVRSGLGGVVTLD